MRLEAFLKFCDTEKIEYKLKEPMRNHTSFKIGGDADVFITAASVDIASRVLCCAKKMSVPVFILGKGSNLLVSDDGIEGVVLNLSGLSSITANQNTITVQAGASLASLCTFAAECGLSGIEFAYGIPGTVGGALYMNAGAYGGEMSQVVISAEYLTSDGEKGIIYAKDMHLGYRTSIFKTSDIIITSVTVSLKADNREKIFERMNDFMTRRKNKQPLDFPSAGSTFKRPEGYYAGALIEQNNLKGEKIGGAMVSEKHAGFIINYKNATCEDVKKLIKIVQQTVLKNNGVELETEVLFVGR